MKTLKALSCVTLLAAAVAFAPSNDAEAAVFPVAGPLAERVSQVSDEAIVQVRHRWTRSAYRWHYSPKHHGLRHKYRRPGFIHFHAGWWYARPWWRGAGAYYHSPRRAYVPRRAGGRCEYWHRQCVRNWGYGGANYRGCMRYHRCW